MDDIFLQVMKRIKRAGGLILMFAMGLFLGILLDSFWFEEDSSPRFKVSGGADESRSFDQGPLTHTLNSGRSVRTSREAEMIRKGILRDANAARYKLLGNDGEVNNYALEIAGLSFDDRDKVKKIVDESLFKVSELMASKVRLNERESDDARGYYVYDIPTFESEGNAVLEELAGQLQEEYGKKASKALVAGLDEYELFGGFGKFESRVVFDDHGHLVNEFVHNEMPQFTLILKDSKTGDIIRTTSSIEPATLRSNLGTAFVERVRK